MHEIGAALNYDEAVQLPLVGHLVPVLTRMAAKRQVGYRSLGYAIEALGGRHPTAAHRQCARQDLLQLAVGPSDRTGGDQL